MAAINGTPELDKCIRNTFEVVNYVDRIGELDCLIKHFNQYLAFDKWQVVRDNDQITFQKLSRVIVDAPVKPTEDTQEKDFLKASYDVNIDLLGLSPDISDIIKLRLKEVEICINNDAALASVCMIGSILEGVLLGVATTYPRLFNQAQCAPKEKDSDSVRKFQDWSLNNFIDVAAEIGILKQDVKKFSHVVRDFRNYIHPYSQMASRFAPDKHTAMICFQVLKAAISQIGDYRSTQGEIN